MNHANRRRLRAVVGGLFCFLLLGLVGTGVPKEPVKTKVIFPPDKSVMVSSAFDVIGITELDRFEVDGKPRPWERFEPPIRVRRIGLGPGFHELQIGDRRLEIVVALNPEEHDGPADWKIYRAHTMGNDEDRCADCHETKQQGGKTVVGELLPVEACLSCHDSVEFDLTHSHPFDPLEDCQMCHSMHASWREKLLKAPAKQLCAECHDA